MRGTRVKSLRREVERIIGTLSRDVFTVEGWKRLPHQLLKRAKLGYMKGDTTTSKCTLPKMNSAAKNRMMNKMVKVQDLKSAWILSHPKKIGYSRRGTV